MGIGTCDMSELNPIDSGRIVLRPWCPIELLALVKIWRRKEYHLGAP